MCDIGKGVTRMLTPSQRQIDFVSAAAPIVGSITGMEAVKAAAAAGMAPAQYGSVPGQSSGYVGTGTSMTAAQIAAIQSGYGDKPPMSTQKKVAIGIGASVVLIGAFMILTSP